MASNIEIPMSQYEILIAAIWGCFRLAENWKEGIQEYGARDEKDGWQNQIMGTIGEQGFAKYLHAYYNAKPEKLERGDVVDHLGNTYEVRASTVVYKNIAHLILHEKDQDEKPYILALAGLDKVILKGWVYGWEGKNWEKYWSDKLQKNRPCFCVPQSDLHSIEELMEIYRKTN